MLDKLEAIYSRYQEIEQQMNDPQITADMKRYVKLSKDYKDLQPVVKAYHDYKALLDNIAECKELLSTEKDEELREMAPTPPTARTPWSRYAAARAATRPASLPATFSACTPATVKRSTGKWKL